MNKDTNRFYARDSYVDEYTPLIFNILKLVLPNGDELEITIKNGALSVRSRDGQLVIKPEVANMITIGSEV